MVEEFPTIAEDAEEEDRLKSLRLGKLMGKNQLQLHNKF